jgi:4-hydroxybenzoate polyprenyltransferase
VTVTPGRVPAREAQTFAGTTRLVKYANFVKLPHTVFALPFALVGVTLASYRAPVTVGMLGWVILAFTCARFTGMGFNRIVDREIDARNPRTSMREIPSGALTVREAVVSVAVASALFVYSAWSLNTLCAVLSPVALAWVCFYSYTKRFTRWSHLVLGLGMSIAPVGGYLAVTGQWPEPWWMPVVLSLAVTAWGGGFDILYALQDEAFDKAHGLHSIPVSLGRAPAISLSRGLHLTTVLSLATVGAVAGGGVLYAIGVLVVAVLLVYEHSLVRVDDISRLDAAFFTMNGVISIVFFLFVLAERLLAARGSVTSFPLGG